MASRLYTILFERKAGDFANQRKIEKHAGLTNL